MLDAADTTAIREGLTAILEHGRKDPSWVNGPDEDIHSFVERQLVERIGDAGRRLHTGRSRNEQVSVDLRLYLRRRIPLLQQGLRSAIEAFVNQAEQAGDALMPSYTHLRRAMPVLVSHFLLSHAVALKRDHERLEQAREEANALPLGSGAIAGTGYAVDTAALAARLGFARVVPNSMDASSDRDFAATFLYATSLAMVHLSRIAEDFILFTSEEFGFFELADSSATGSSMMPQKKNPDPLELVRGKTGRAVGHLMGLLVTMKGLPTGYNKDMQEDKEPLFDSEDTLAVSAAAVAAVISQAHPQPAAHRTGRVGIAARHGRGRLPGVARHAVPAGTRGGRRHGAAAARRRARHRSADDCGVAGVQPAVRGRCQGTGHGGGVGPRQAHTAVHAPRRRARRGWASSARGWPVTDANDSCVAVPRRYRPAGAGRFRWFVCSWAWASAKMPLPCALRCFDRSGLSFPPCADWL